MSNAKVVMGQAANTLVKPLEVEDVFSTYLYTGNNNGSSGGSNPTRKITNGINLEDEGGLIWFKVRDTNPYRSTSILMDSERSDYSKAIFTSETDSESDVGDFVINSVQQDGFTLGYYGWTNYTDDKMASWTFRKAPKFFDVVTYSGDGVNNRAIPHNLNSEVGTIIVKRTDTAENWYVYHRSEGNTQFGNLNSSGAFQAGSYWPTTPTSTEFYIGSGAQVNAAAGTYVAYLFAHNDGDGGFGADGDADIIKCGSYAGNDGILDVNLGFEPQFVLIKNASAAGDDWIMFDTMRGFPAAGDHDAAMRLFPNLSDSEALVSRIGLTSTGFGCNPASNAGAYNASGNTYIYMAIRRGTKVPESGTEVFSVSTRNASEPAYTSGFPVDFALARAKDIANNWDTGSRLQQGNRMFTNLTNAEASNSNMMFDYQDGWSAGTGASTEYLSWMWKRAPSFFDVVAYTGNGTAGRTVPSNLDVPSEMIWGKRRDSTGSWLVYHKDLSAGQYLFLNADQAPASYPFFGTQTAEGLVLNNAAAGTLNGSGEDYIAYLFASLPGISKVGSYTGNGTSQNIDCGFTSGARFVLIKNTSTAGTNWMVFDSTRGIVSASEPHLRLNSTNAEVTNDQIDPYSGGFALTDNDQDTNGSGSNYIFYAIA